VGGTASRELAHGGSPGLGTHDGEEIGSVDELCYLSASEALRQFKSRSLSPVELLDALYARLEAVNPSVNAVAEELFVEARQLAHAAADRYVSHPHEVRPLEGLPVAPKAEQPIKGHAWPDGSLAYADRVADVTHPIIDRIRDAGGIIHIRTTTPEFSCAAFTHSKLWGVTRNPWNLHYSPGGSSGGSGAALAAGMTPLATGSDIGGSIRIPASFSGVVGFKPPHGRVPDLPPFNLDAYCHVGPLARTVGDCALLQNTIVGPHPVDADSLRPAVMIDTEPDGVQGLRIALAVNLGDWHVEPEVEANIRAVAAALRDAGAVLEEVEVGMRRAEVTHATHIHFSGIMGHLVADEVKRHGDLLTPYAKQFAERFTPADPPEAFLAGFELEAAIHARIAPILERCDALICPTAGYPALVAGEDYVDRGFEVAGKEVDPMFDATLTLPFNILSQCPVLAVPSGWAQNGVPTGVQIVGRTYDDQTVFRVGASLEQVRPWGYGDAEHLPNLTAQVPA
jgi:aspartyl-tRNA(Asn)/glutamyl-tRNA(Gln) amidotransferase subunit A